MKSYVYVLPLSDKKLFKIGRTDDLSGRIRTLSMFYDFDKERAFALECKSTRESILMENTFHHIFNHNRVLLEPQGGTEFFNDTAYKDVSRMMKIISKQQNTRLLKLYQMITESEGIDDSDKYLYSLCDSIKHKRVLLNISQQELSEITKISKRTIERIESHIGSPSFLIIYKLLKALGIDVKIDAKIEATSINERATNK